MNCAPSIPSGIANITEGMRLDVIWYPNLAMYYVTVTDLETKNLVRRHICEAWNAEHLAQHVTTLTGFVLDRPHEAFDLRYASCSVSYDQNPDKEKRIETNCSVH